MYDATTARFLQDDTYSGTASDPLSLNRYTYCANNPVVFVDPSGHDPIMLRYIVEKNGGTTSYNSETGKVSVKIGTTFNEYNGTISNGRMLVDSKTIAYDFGITDNLKVTHQPGDKFDTVDDAAIAFALAYNKESIEKRHEFGAAKHIKVSEVSSDSYKDIIGKHVPNKAVTSADSAKVIGLAYINDIYRKNYITWCNVEHDIKNNKWIIRRDGFSVAADVVIDEITG